MPKRKQQRLADATYMDASGKQQKRYGVHPTSSGNLQKLRQRALRSALSLRALRALVIKFAPTGMQVPRKLLLRLQSKARSYATRVGPLRPGRFVIWDRERQLPLWNPGYEYPLWREFRSLLSAENYLKRTTVRWYQIEESTDKLDRRGAA